MQALLSFYTIFYYIQVLTNLMQKTNINFQSRSYKHTKPKPKSIHPIFILMSQTFLQYSFEYNQRISSQRLYFLLQRQFQFVNSVTTLSQQMSNQNFSSPISFSNNSTPLRNSRSRKFMRKPSQGSQRSSSRKSFEADSYKQSYIKTPTAIKKNNSKQQDFFVSLAHSIIKLNVKEKKCDIEKPEQSDRTNLTEQEDFKFERKVHYDQQTETTIRNLNTRIKILQAELDLRNHEASILSSECQRFKKLSEDQKQRRRILQNEKKQLSKQLKQVTKNSDTLKIEAKKLQKQREHFLKQIEFFERINYDQKTRSLQSYREVYLQEQLQKIRKQYNKSRGERELQLQNDIRVIKQEKYTIQSHMKALKLANQCLVKQINHNQESLHDIIMNSQEYKKLREKYVRFLEQYKLLRNQYWALKAETNKKGMKSEESQIFSITASQVQNDLSELRISNQNTEILQYLTVPSVPGKVK